MSISNTAEQPKSQAGKNASGAAFSRHYDQLRRMARARLRQHQAFTLLDTHALVHESYLKLFGMESTPMQDQGHFFAYASSTMRSIIVDFARARATERRGGSAEILGLDTALSEQLSTPIDDVLRVHEALAVLEKVDADLARLVEMRYFGGFTELHIAQSLSMSERTVRRNWEKAKILLAAQLR